MRGFLVHFFLFAAFLPGISAFGAPVDPLSGFQQDIARVQASRLVSLKLKSFNESIESAVRTADDELEVIHSEYRYSQGFRDDDYWSRRSAIDRRLNRRIEVLFLNATFNPGDTTEVTTGRQAILIPSEALRFPLSVSNLLRKGADATFAPEGKSSTLETALKIREPEALREILHHDSAYINRKTSKGTPLFSLVLKKIRYSRDEAAHHKGRPSCPPSCYGSWKKTAEAWHGMADEILNEGVVDLSSTDAKGVTALETAVIHRLDTVGRKIFDAGGARSLQAADLKRLRLRAHKFVPARKLRHFDFLFLENRQTGDAPRRTLDSDSNNLNRDGLEDFNTVVRKIAQDETRSLERPAGEQAIPLPPPETDGDNEGVCRVNLFRSPTEGGKS